MVDVDGRLRDEELRAQFLLFLQKGTKTMSPASAGLNVVRLQAVSRQSAVTAAEGRAARPVTETGNKR